jgi:hypothetical protein
MMTTNIEEIPSKQLELLNSLKGLRITSLVRCSCDSYDEFDEYGLYGIAEHDFFRFATGPVVIVFENGLEISFSSAEDISSVITWVQKKENGAAKC